MRVLRVVGLLLSGVPVMAGGAFGGTTSRVCWPGFTVPAVTLPATTIPATTIPAVTIPRACIAGSCYPKQHYPAVHFAALHLPALRIPAAHIAGSCFSGAELKIPDYRTVPLTHVEPISGRLVLPPAQTTVRVSGYAVIDRNFSPQLSASYWRDAGPTVSYPDPAAPGYGELNAAGFPKNQYVRPYVRRDGTVVSGYWRNSPADGLPTCKIIAC